VILDLWGRLGLRENKDRKVILDQWDRLDLRENKDRKVILDQWDRLGYPVGRWCSVK
jgi:hypothetical protein